MTIIDEKNWSKNYTYSAERLHYPHTVEEVQPLVQECSKLRALGTRHSFNGIADSTSDMVSLAHFNKIVGLDRSSSTVTIEGGVRYGEVAAYLHQEGYALHNLASLPHISVAGACATATHGSGVGNGNLATAVSAMEFVDGNGDLVTVSRETNGEDFDGMVVGLGGLGVITKLTLDILPTFAVRQDLYENLPLAQLDTNAEAVFASAYSVSLFTDWQAERFNQVWLKRRITEDTEVALEPEWFAATLATDPLHPIASLSAESCTAQRGVPGPWHERLPHFRMDHQPSYGEELQSEYFVPRERAVEGLYAIGRLREQIAPLLQISEVRTIKADNLWMSPCYRQDCVAFHFTWKKDWPAVEKLLPQIEEQLAPLQPRPHWGKLFTLPPERVQSLYAKLPDFQRLLHRYDPQGKFRNAFLDAYLFETH